MSDEKKIRKALSALNKQVHGLCQKFCCFTALGKVKVTTEMISGAVILTKKRAKTIPALVQFLLRFRSTPELAAQEKELLPAFASLLLAVEKKDSEEIIKNVDALVLKLALLEKGLEILFGDRIITPKKYRSIQ